MKNLLLGLMLLISSIVFAQKQEPIIDSIQVYTVIKEVDGKRQKADLAATMYEFKGFYDKLTKMSDESGNMEYIVKYYYRLQKDGPQMTYTSVLTRNK